VDTTLLVGAATALARSYQAASEPASTAAPTGSSPY